MILSEDSIILLMFLNYSTSMNSLVGKTSNGTNIMLYGHVNERYPERIGRIQEVTKAKYLKFNNILQRAIKLTKEHYNECINTSKEKVRHTIRDVVYLECEDGKMYAIDISILVTGTVVGYHPEYPKTIEPQYRDWLNKRMIKENDNILSFETLATTIRFADEKPINFSYQPTVASFNFPQRVYKVTKQDILYITEFMIEDKDTMVSKHAIKMLDHYKKDIEIIM